MFQEQGSKAFETLKQRAAIVEKIRTFFRERDFLEVETPILAKAAHTDPYIEPLQTQVHYQGRSHRCYLQTSPEFAMKRLLAAGSPPIFQVTKAFRDGDFGQYHNPEFTILEWYRPHYDHHQLMQEVDEFFQIILGTSPAQRILYRELFLKFFNFDPFGVDLEILKHHAFHLNASKHVLESDKDTLLQYLLGHVESSLGKEAPLFIYDFPASQSVLAKVVECDGRLIAERFEIYYQGLELGNGFYELTDPKEQRQRFEADLHKRRLLRKPEVPIDEFFLKSLSKLPSCAGVAMGVDRLVMLATNTHNLADVMGFTIDEI